MATIGSRCVLSTPSAEPSLRIWGTKDITESDGSSLIPLRYFGVIEICSHARNQALAYYVAVSDVRLSACPTANVAPDDNRTVRVVDDILHWATKLARLR